MITLDHGGSDIIKVPEIRLPKRTLDFGTNNSSSHSVKGDSFMNKLIKWSLGLCTLIGIWKYLILPMFL